MSDRSHITGYRMAAVFTPILALGAFQFFLDEPSSAQASQAAIGSYLLPEIPSGLSLRESAQREYEKVTSPFWFVESEVLLPEPMVFQNPIEQPVIKTDPVFRLSSVLPSPTKSYAVVNGKARSQGDEIEPGWILIKINGDDRSIILQHTSGRKIKVLMNQN